jgi:hypothetical protein
MGIGVGIVFLLEPISGVTEKPFTTALALWSAERNISFQLPISKYQTSNSGFANFNYRILTSGCGF